jgi:CBS domain-containing protein
MNTDLVRGIVRGRSVIVQSPTATVRDAARVMADHGIGAVPVVEGRHLIGIFTERDVVTRVVAAGRSPDRTRLEQVMTRRPETVSVDCPLVEALHVMISGGFRHLPVMARGEVVGVISIRDIPAEYHLLRQTWIEAKDEMQV